MDSNLYSPEDQCSRILAEIRSSNLHYLVQESPFSMYLTLRKKFTKKSTKSDQKVQTSPSEIQNLEDKVNKLRDEKNSLEELLKQTELECEASKDVVKLFEEKLEKAESEFLKQCTNFKEIKDDNVSETKLLKVTVKNANEEIKKLKKDLSEANKVIKTNEKNIYNLEQNLESTQEKNKILKDENNKFKLDKKKSEKKEKKKPQKDLVLPLTFKHKGNQTDLPPSISNRDNNNLGPLESVFASKISTQRIYTPACCPSTTLPSSSILATTPNHTSSSAITMDITSPLPRISSNLDGPAPNSSLVVSSPSTNTCHHTPQCLLRHPNPPSPFAPITFEEFYHPTKPPSHIFLLPSHTLSYGDFRELEGKGNHKCEECDVDMLFHSYTERVEYFDPGPSGGITGMYLRVCPNSPRATISMNLSEEKSMRTVRNKKMSLKCNFCSKISTTRMEFCFHVNRKHASK